MRITAHWQARWLVVLALYGTFIGGTFITEHQLAFRAFHHVFLTVLLGGWLVSLIVRRRTWPGTSLDIPLAALFAVGVWSSFCAEDPRISVEELWRLATNILIFYAVIDLLRATKPRTLFEPIFFAASVTILIAAMEMSSWYFGVPRLALFPQSWIDIGGLRELLPPVIHRLTFTMLVSTFLSAYMALLIPVALAWMISSGSLQTRRGLLLWLMGAVIVEILTFSRGGLLSLAASLPTFGALAMIGSADWRERIVSVLRDRRVRVGLVIALLFAALVAIVWARQTNLAGHQAGDQARFDLWQSAWQIGVHDPLTGAGLGNFGRAMRPYRDPTWTRDGYTSPHNIPLLIWAEQGIWGVMALMSCAAMLVWTGYQRWRAAGGAERVRVAGSIAALVGFSVHNLFDTFLNTMPVMLPVYVITAYLAYPIELRLEARIGRWIPRLALAVLIMGQIGWLISDLAQLHFTRAIGLMDGRQLETALAEIDSAQRLDPTLGLYAAQRAQILGLLAVEDDRYLDQALDAYEAALKFEGTYDLLHANYAGLLARSGDLDNALAHMRRAESIQPGIPLYDFWIGRYTEQLGQDQAAREAYRNSLDDNWSFAVSPYWDITPLRTEVRDSFLSERGFDRLSLPELAVLPSSCWPPIPPGDSEQKGAMELRCGGEYNLRISGNGEDVLRALSVALDRDPTDGPAYTLRAEAYFSIGDLASAEHDARTAIFLGDLRGYYPLGQIAEAQGDFEAAENYYALGGPNIAQTQEWDVAVYGRRGSLSILPLPELDAPGPTRYDFAAWLALARLYEQLGQPEDAERVYQAMRALDPFTTISG